LWEQIIGQSQLKNGLWHATRWDQGRPIDLGTLGGGSSFAGSLNDRGDAAGNSAVLSLYDFHAAAWFNGKPVNLSLDGEIQSYANGINNRGQVTGITNYSDGTWHSFIWEDGARTELPRPSGDVFSSFINNKGTVCGGANFPTAFHAYTYHGKGLVDLDPTSQWWFSSCSGLNDNGHAVGAFSGQVGNRAFLWRNAKEGMINLNSMTPPDSRTSLFTAFNINEDDQITAAGYVDGQLHGFLLTPRMCSVRCVTAPRNLIAWWPGEGNAEDVMGGSAGVVQGVQFAPAAVRLGFVFDGFDDAIEVPDSPALHSITRQITFMAWINPEVPVAPDGSSGEYLGNLFSRRDPLVSEGISFQVRNDGALWTVLDTTNGGFWIGSWNPIKFDGNWKHLAMIVDTDAGRIAYYINGELLHEEYPDGLLGSQFRDVSHTYIGQRQGNDAGEGAYATMHYRGMMDEIQLFNRSLTSSEVKTIYQAGPKGVCKR
jgi:probable HAF family extracellular repeat protein